MSRRRNAAAVRPEAKIIGFCGAASVPQTPSPYLEAFVSKPILKSSKLHDVCYDIRGPVLDKAREMEDEGHKIIKLNIGNLAVFGLEPPDEIVQDMIRNLPHSAGYTDSKGLFAPRKAVVHYTQEKNIAGVGVDDVYLGNGASELIAMSLNALLDAGDEVLVPAPDYPLWTAAVSLSGGRPVHYHCDEQADWTPDIADIRAKITPSTRGIVVINPNNPTGALYPTELLQQIVELARQHQLIVFADEIYDKTLYDGHSHTSIAALADDVLFVTFNGFFQVLQRAGVVVFVIQELGVEIVRIDAVRVDLQRLPQILLRFLVVAETDREARHLVVERAEAGICRAIQRIGVEQHCRVELLARLFCQAERAEATFHPRRGTEHDAFPDQRLRALRVLLAESGSPCDQFVESGFALRLRRGVVCCRPVGLYGQ